MTSVSFSAIHSQRHRTVLSDGANARAAGAESRLNERSVEAIERQRKVALERSVLRADLEIGREIAWQAQCHRPMRRHSIEPGPLPSLAAQVHGEWPVGDASANVATDVAQGQRPMLGGHVDTPFHILDVEWNHR